MKITPRPSPSNRDSAQGMETMRHTGLSLRLGALAPELSTQLGESGLDKKQIRQYQQDADAITRLSVRGYISESDARRFRQSLVMKIERQVRDGI